MSLYEGLEEFLLPNVSEAKRESGSNFANVTPSLKLLESHMHLKRVSSAQNKEAKKTPSTALTFAPNKVVTANKPTIQSKKVLVEDAQPLSFLPIQNDESSANEWRVDDEYNPMFPNVYEKLIEEKEQERIQQITQIQHSLALNYLSSSDDEEYSPTTKEELGKRSMGVAIAPPQQLVEEDSKTYAEPIESPRPKQECKSGSKGLNFAARIMERYGYKQGSGLGKDEQGMSTALQIEKTGFNLGKIVHERDLIKDESLSQDVHQPVQPVAEPAVQPVTEILKHPTKVMLLRNMVGAGQVDDDLQPEVQEEMLKFGEVKRCVIEEVANVEDWAAVRIFVEFAKVDQAIKAVVALNGRFFGGRAVHASFFDADKFANGILTD